MASANRPVVARPDPNQVLVNWKTRAAKEDAALFNLLENIQRERGQPLNYLRTSFAATGWESHVLRARTAARASVDAQATSGRAAAAGSVRSRSRSVACLSATSSAPNLAGRVGTPAGRGLDEDEDTRSVATRCGPRHPRARSGARAPHARSAQSCTRAPARTAPRPGD